MWIKEVAGKMEKPYIINLRFETSQRQIWFSGEDTAECQERFDQAAGAISEIGDSCSTASEFYTKVIAHFKANGFELSAK